MKLLTVSVAAFNVEKYIRECLKSFCSTLVRSRVEVLIIDDGGTDHTAEIAKEFEEQYPDTFRLIRKDNGGWGSTVNTAIHLATGKYFKQLDGDDFFSAENLPAFLDQLESIDADLVLTPYKRFHSETGEFYKVLDPTETFNVKPFELINLSDLHTNVTVNMHQCTFLTTVLKKNRITLLEHAFYTDVELVVKALYYSKTVILLPFSLYCYRTSYEGQSISIGGIRKHYREHLEALFRNADFLHQAETRPGLGLAITRLQGMIYFQYVYFLRLKPSFQHKKEMMDYDSKLKKMYPEFYDNDSKLIKAIRCSHGLLYLPLCWWLSCR